MNERFSRGMGVVLAFLAFLAGAGISSAKAQSWINQGFISVSSSQPDARLGAAMASSGDFLAVGAPGLDQPFGPVLDTLPQAGAVMIYRWQQDHWLLEQTLRSPTPTANQQFGASVALLGDVLLVGAPGYATASSTVGRVYIFTRVNSGDFNYQAGFTSQLPGDPRFGTRVKLTTQGNGVFFALFSGPGVDSGALTDLGEIRIRKFNVGPTGLVALQGQWNLQAPDGNGLTKQAGEQFGSSLAVDALPCLSADCSPSYYIAIGSPRYDAPAAVDAGRVSFFRFTPSTVPDSSDLTLEASFSDILSGIPDAQFGYAVDIDAGAVLGTPTLVVSAVHGDSGNGITSGWVKLYNPSQHGSDWLQTGYLEGPTPQSGDDFGAAVALSGSQLVIGAPGRRSGQFNDVKGEVYLAEASASPMLHPSFSNGSALGTSLAVTPSCIVAGAPRPGDILSGFNTWAKGWPLNVFVDAGGAVTGTPGNIDCQAANCSVDMLEGTVITLTATAAPGYVFTGWYGDCNGQVGSTCQVMMDQERIVGAHFAVDNSHVFGDSFE